MKRKIDDIKEIHCLGNGHVCAFARGLDLFDVFGPHYSAPAAVTLEFVEDREKVSVESERQSETAIWTHTVYLKESRIGTVTEYAAANETVILREVDFERPVRFSLKTNKVERLYEVPEEATGIPNFYYGEIPEGVPFYIYSVDRDKYHGFVNNRKFYFGVVLTGDGSITRESPEELTVTVRKGTLGLLFALSFEEIFGYAGEITSGAAPRWRGETEIWWRDLADARKKRVDSSDPSMAGMCDDTYILIKARQSVTGGILACYRGHMAYVRDTYGIVRGLLALGAWEDAKSALRFYLDTFNAYGAIHCAQGTDTYAFHIHENDKTELTGYVILTFIEYYRRTGDLMLLKEAMPLLRWCVEQQHGILRRGMLPFNGDETYIAGFILPHEIINHGSAEATILYHTACRRMLEAADELELSLGEREKMLADKNEIENSFADNFYVDGRLAVNNPGYYGEGEQPLFRGFVRLCGHGNGIGILDKSNRYVCFDCYRAQARENPEFSQRYFLTSPLLMSVYVGSELIAPEMLEREFTRIAEELIRNGYKCNPEKTVGYEPGMLLLILNKKRPEMTEGLREMVLRMRDEYGTWSEYYLNNQPNGAMYRPWESGINCEALLETQ